MKHLYTLIVLCLAVILNSCGDDTEFRITGQVTGMGTRNTYIIYDSNGTLYEVHSPSLDGKFNFVGNSPDYTIAEIFSSSKDLLGRVLIKNGQTLKCKFDLDNPYDVSIKGNKPSEEWSEFLSKNAEVLSDGYPDVINSVIEKYVESHRNSIVSTVLMMTLYHVADNESRADSIIETIEPEARPDALINSYRSTLAEINNSQFNGRFKSFSLMTAADTLERFSPSRSSYSLFFFTASQGERRDTIMPVLRYFNDKYPRKRFRIEEISLASDTLLWKNIQRRDSLPWPSVWAPGGASNPLFIEFAVPKTPYYILGDSTGRQIYRGSSLHHAMDSLEKRLQQPAR